MPDIRWRFLPRPRCAALAILIAFAAPGLAQQYGLQSVAPVGAFFNGALPRGADAVLALEDAYPNLRFRDPLVFTPEPRSTRIFVGSRQGVIESFDNDRNVPQKQVFLDLTDRVAVVWDGGFLGLVCHPDWNLAGSPNRNYLYVWYSYHVPGTSYPTSSTSGFFNCWLRLSRFTRNESTGVVDPASEAVMVHIRLYNGSHRGGGMLFRDDGMLYVSIGDQFRDATATAQDIAGNFEGGVIRIDVDRRGGAVSFPPRRRMGVQTGQPEETSGNFYYVPGDNPFVTGDSSRFEEFWTLGHRNPHRMTLDPQTQRIWSGEIGQNSREEVNVIEGGRNYQWPFMEGTIPFRTRPPAVLGIEQPPVIDFTRSEANAIIGGYVYRGSRLPQLQGRYICGDHIRRNVWALDYDPATNRATKQYLLEFSAGQLCTFGRDHAGEVYLCGLGTDVPIRRFTTRNSYPEPPALLSGVGIFTNMAALTPAPSLIPYDVNTPLWSDGAVKRRWLCVPNDGTPNSAAEQIAYSEEGEWGFPVGTVLVKHFETPAGRRLETRLLVHGENDWYGVTYKWNAAGTDAVLLTDGLVEPVEINGLVVDYAYPSRQDCLVCHNQAAGRVNGLKTRQLNRTFLYPQTGVADNQLRALSHVGLLSPAIVESELPQKLTSAPLDAPAASLEWRLRSYLDANCSQCHRPGAGHTAVDFRMVRALPFQGIVDGPVADPLGIADPRIVAPGDLGRSILWQRVRGSGACCSMPPLGRAAIDRTFVAMLQRWITTMDADARAGAAAQSSTDFGAGPERAVDGDTRGDFNLGSVTHTLSTSQPYWDLDLGTQYHVDSVRLWNRTDCCGDRLADFWVFLSPLPFLGTTVAAAQQQPGVTARHFPGTASATEKLALGAEGRWLRVQLAGSNPLSLAEVRIDGWSVPVGPRAPQDKTPQTKTRR